MVALTGIEPAIRRSMLVQLVLSDTKYVQSVHPWPRTGATDPRRDGAVMAQGRRSSPPCADFRTFRLIPAATRVMNG